jgi:hypothetical protein
MTPGNYNRYRGKDNAGKRKIQFGNEIAKIMNDHGVRPERTAKQVTAKIAYIERRFFRFSSITAQTRRHIITWQHFRKGRIGNEEMNKTYVRFRNATVPTVVEGTLSLSYFRQRFLSFERLSSCHLHARYVYHFATRICHRSTTYYILRTVTFVTRR